MTTDLHTFTVEVLHNETRTDDGRLAIFDRWGEHRVRPGDALRAVGTLDVTAPSSAAAAEVAFAIGNGARPESATYYGWRVRSLCAGDVVVVHTPDGQAAYGCEGSGWSLFDLSTAQVTR